MAPYLIYKQESVAIVCSLWLNEVWPELKSLKKWNTDKKAKDSSKARISESSLSFMYKKIVLCTLL